jgi:hypothetical protein
MVLPAGGVVLCWLLLMTLWLPLLDYARSYRPVVDRVVPHLSASQGSCVDVRGASTSLVASLEVFSGLRYDATAVADKQSACESLIQVTRGSFRGPPESLMGWELQATILRPTDRDEQIGVYRRVNREP